MSEKNGNRVNAEYLIPDIFSMIDVFASQLGSSASENADLDHPGDVEFWTIEEVLKENEKERESLLTRLQQIRKQHAGLGRGFLEGSTILMVGPPGSGKTVASLAMIRDLMQQDIAANVKTRSRLYVISAELGFEKMRAHHAAFEWFGSGSSGEDGWFNTQTKSVCFPVEPDVRMDRPFMTSEELVNQIFSNLKSLHQHSDFNRAFVLVDSLSGILRDCRDVGDRRRMSYEFIARLVKVFKEGGSEKLGLAFLCSERGSGHDDVSVEENQADCVIKLDLKDTGSGRRLRTWEATKTHGTYLHTGEHSWAILTSESINGVIASNNLAAWIRGLVLAKEGQLGANPPRWGTIAIFPRPRQRKIGDMNKSTDDSKGDGTSNPGAGRKLK